MLSMELPKKRQVRFDPEVNTPMDFQFTMAALRDVQEERKDLSIQLQEAKDAMEQMSAELQLLRQTHREAPAFHGTVECNGEAQAKDLDAARAEVIRLSDELRTAKELLEWARSQIEGQKAEVETARQAHGKAAVELTAQTDVAHLWQQQAMRRIEDLQAQVEAAHRQRSEFLEATAKVKVEYEELLQLREASARQDKEELLRLREVAREIEALRAERSAASQQLEAYASMSGERDKLLSSLQNLSKEHTNMSIQLDESRHEVTRLQSKLADASKESTSAAQLHEEQIKLHAECEKMRSARDIALQKQSQLSASLERVSRQAEEDARALMAERDVLLAEKGKWRRASADIDLAALKDEMQKQVHEADAGAREAELTEALMQQRAAHAKQLSQLQQILEVRSKADKAAREAVEASARHRIEVLEAELAKVRRLTTRPSEGGCFAGLLGQ